MIIGVAVLILGVPIGDFLAKKTKDELKSGQAWFKAIIILSIVGSIIAAFYRSDVLLFSFLFIAVVSSRSLIK